MKLDDDVSIGSFFVLADRQTREEFVRENPACACRLFMKRKDYIVRDDSFKFVRSENFDLREDNFIKACYEELGQEFVRQHGNSKDYSHSAYFVSQMLGAPIARKEIRDLVPIGKDFGGLGISYMGSSKPEHLVPDVDLNWREQNVVENAIRTLEG